jgi:hypothetical protein
MMNPHSHTRATDSRFESCSCSEEVKWSYGGRKVADSLAVLLLVSLCFETVMPGDPTQFVAISMIGGI